MWIPTRGDRRPAGGFVSRASAATVCFALWACAAHAQTSTGGIRGIVRDTTGAVLTGVTIETASPERIGGAAVEVTDAQGAYRFENLPVGLYSVTFTLQGFTTIKRGDIRVEVGRSIEVDQTMSLGSVQESLTVTGDSPVVDTLHAASTTNFNKQLIENIPSSRNSFFDLIAYAPAVKTTAIGASGFNIFGSNSDQNSLQYDGVDVSAPKSGSAWDWPNYDMMQEVEIRAVGASAEYTGFQGGVINIVLRSGSNTVRGSGSFYGLWNSLVANNLPAEPLPYNVQHRLDYNFALGGPVKKDRLWVQYINEYILDRTTDVGIDPKFAGTIIIWRPFVKVTARVSNQDQIEASYNDCRDWWPFGAGKTRTPEAQSVEIGYDPPVTARWAHTFGSATMLEVKGGGVYVRKGNVPFSGDFTTPGHFDLATGNNTVNRGYQNRTYQNKTNLNATLAHTATDFLKGTHEFKFGVQTAYGVAIDNLAYASGMKLYDFGGAPSYALFREPYSVGARIRTAGGFAQDNWTVSDRVALNLGLRYDHTRGDVPDLDQLSALTAANDRSFDLRTTGKTFDGVPNLITWRDISPRLGTTIKLDQAGKTVVKTSWGRYYGKLVGSMFNYISPGATVQNYFNFNAASGKYDIPYFSVDPKANYGIDPNLTNQYTDTLFVGLERQVRSSFGINATFVYKKEHNFIRLEDVAGVYAPQPYVDTFNGITHTLTVYNRVSPSSQSLFEVTNRPDFDQDYKTFVLEANKRWSDKWQVLASYQWQRALGYAGGGLTTQGFGSLSPSGFGRDPNDLTNAFGRTATDTTHAIRVSTTYEAPFAIHLGMRYFYDSGRPYARVVTVRALRQGSRTVIADPRGDYQLPSLSDLRLRLDKDFGFGGARRVRLSLDLINMFNSGTPVTVRNNSTQAGFGDLVTAVVPRRAQVGLRFEF
jgi:hypothetical protein